MRGGLVQTEHIYWELASVLAQVGLLGRRGLAVINTDQIDSLVPRRDPSAFNRLLGA